MVKNFLIALFALLPTLAFAGVDRELLHENLVGRYQFESIEGKVTFLVRSSGAIEIVDNDYWFGEITYLGSSDSELHDGLPIAAIVITTGSDEDVRDYHFLLTVSQDEDGETLYVLNSFQTFNDGPNSLASFDNFNITLQKYNKDTKKYEDVP